MKVIEITDDFPPFIGGMASHAWELSKALVDLGHHVTVLTAARLRYKESRFQFERQEIHEGVEIIHLGFNLIARRYYGFSINRLARKRVAWIQRKTREVVLHVHENLRPPVIRRWSDLPMVWTNHSSMFLGDFEELSKRQDLIAVVKSCDWITAPSKELCSKTIALGFPKERVTYIPNGVDATKFSAGGGSGDRVLSLNGKEMHFPANVSVVLCARRFVEKNGVHVYLDALETINPEIFKKACFLFAGNNSKNDGQYGEEIVIRLTRLSQRGQVHLLGAVPNDLMPQLYKVADISVLPSLKEATSITGLESMAAGVPVVGTNVGGIPEIVENGVDGLLCPPNDAHALGEALTRFILDRDLRVGMGMRARERVLLRFSWRKIAAQFAGIFQSVLDFRRGLG